MRGAAPILLDAGAASASSARWVAMLEKQPALVLLSHAHADHIGALPDLLTRYPSARMFASAETIALGAHALQGVLTSRGASRDAARRQAGAQTARMTPLAPMRAASFSLGDEVAVTITPFPCGHILGAVAFLLEIRREGMFHRILYLPDFCAHDQPIVEQLALPVPTEDAPIHTVVMEGVLGANKSVDAINYDAEMQRLCADVAARRGPLLAALAALGEAPEVAWGLLRQQAVTRVTVHASLKPVFRVYAQARADVTWEGVRFAQRRECAQILDAKGVVIAPGEHLEHGTPAYYLAGRIAEQRDATICVLNSLRRRSPAGALHRAERGDEARFGRRTVIKRAALHYYILPNHAPRWALTGAVRALAPERVILVHGRQRDLGFLKGAIEKEYTGDVMLPEQGASVSLDLV